MGEGDLGHKTFLPEEQRMLRLVTCIPESQGVTKHTLLQNNKCKVEKEAHGCAHREISHRKQDRAYTEP